MCQIYLVYFSFRLRIVCLQLNGSHSFCVFLHVAFNQAYVGDGLKAQLNSIGKLVINNG
uniref:Uncharacterized protein n=1 Tax=Rhizophora mucronata TaxID=61149 RepID=A0A2P2MGS9_RHIMU